MNIILLAPPAAGKGTQSELLIEKYNLNQISTGNLLREIASSDTELGKKIKELLASGNLVSDNLVLKVLENYLDKDNQLHPVQMGCYGIGIGRIIASVIEQNHDEKGIIWPMNIAPFKVAIVLIDKKNDLQSEVAEKLYADLTASGIDTVLDDRDERVGVKFNDMELIGIPIRITVGKKVNDGELEIKLRDESDNRMCKIEEAEDLVKNIIKSKMK